MKFYTSGSLFDYYAYLLYGREGQCFSVMMNRYQKHDVGHTFTFCDQGFFVIHVLYDQVVKSVTHVFFYYSKLKSSM